MTDDILGPSENAKAKAFGEKTPEFTSRKRGRFFENETQDLAFSDGPIVNLEEDMNCLLATFPPHIRKNIEAHPDYLDMIEVILDLGRKPQVRFHNSEEFLDLDEVRVEDIDYMVSRLADFNADNRAGIERTLHRISAIRNRLGKILGLTCRVGRAVLGSVEVIQDIVLSGKNILFLGPPGVGKTTKLREAARLLSEKKYRVMVVDTSNEIAGEGDIVHPGIGHARRMQVKAPDLQYQVMIEAIENHMPEVIIVDEIGTEEESKAARTIAERGVQLLATAHGHTLENVIKNPTLSDLLGGIQPVILGDDEANLRGTQKAILERKLLPTFDVLIELREWDKLAIFHDTKHSVDRFLRAVKDKPEIRQSQGRDWQRVQEASVDFEQEVDAFMDVEEQRMQAQLELGGSVRIFPFGLSKDRLYTAIHALDVPAIVAHKISDADIVLTSKAQLKAKSKMRQILEGRQIPLHVVKRNSSTHIMNFLKFYFKLADDDQEIEEEAKREIRKLCRQVQEEKRSIEASPRPGYIRRIQHEIVDELGLHSTSVGEDPNRRLRIYP